MLKTTPRGAVCEDLYIFIKIFTIVLIFWGAGGLPVAPRWSPEAPGRLLEKRVLYFFTFFVFVIVVVIVVVVVVVLVRHYEKTNSYLFAYHKNRHKRVPTGSF